MLLGNNAQYLTNFESVQQITDVSQRNKWDEMRRLTFLNEIIFATISDLRSANTTYLDKKRVKGYYVNTNLAMASENELIFKIVTGSHISIVPKAAGAIDAGALLTYTSVDVLLSIGNNLLTLGEYRSAIDDFATIVKESNNSNVLSAAWNQMGLCYRQLEDHYREIDCYYNALQYDPDNTTIRENKRKCLKSISDREIILSI